ncbi:MAG: UbiA family prenyltransferase [Pirellulales bacterium]
MSGKLRAYFELLRFPAVFTALADVMMGFLVTQGELHPGRTFALLAAISALLYLSGMVFNDVFDAEVDSLERPRRPIPSGRISYRAAFMLGACLMGLGLLVSAHFGEHTSHQRPAAVSIVLAGCILLYDGGAKRTFAGPLVMGSCRLLNVLLGMSLASAADGLQLRPWTTDEWLLAAGVGTYVAGVTVFARGEAAVSERSRLAGGIAILAAGLAAVAAAPLVVPPLKPLALGTFQWLLLWSLLALVIVRRCILAWQNPHPEPVQQAVRTCLRSIIVIDAAVVLGYCGALWGCAVLALLVPMLLLERWASTT